MIFHKEYNIANTMIYKYFLSKIYNMNSEVLYQLIVFFCFIRSLVGCPKIHQQMNCVIEGIFTLKRNISMLKMI